jgi:flagellin
MAVSIGSNIASLQAQRRLNATADQLGATYGKLASGQRITKAADDAAGLAVADTLRSNARMSAVAMRNANDGISFLAIADGAMNEIGNILTRMSELAAQASNGTFSSSQRTALNSEASALKDEIDRITAVTTFNGNGIINASGTNVTLQVGIDNSTNSQISIATQNATATGLGIGTFDLATTTNAGTAVTNIGTAISSLASRRGALGAIESRLRSTVSTLGVARENFMAAESRIRDVDVAAESAELTRLSILQQAGASVLAQANQAPALALSLLG